MLDGSLDQINVWISKCGQCASANVSFYYESRSRVLIKYFLNIANKLKREETLYSGRLGHNVVKMSVGPMHNCSGLPSLSLCHIEVIHKRGRHVSRTLESAA